MNILYVIEKRDEERNLVLTGRQPEDIFGDKAYKGITQDEMIKVIWRVAPDAALRGDNIGNWAKAIDPRFVIREKTW